MTGTDLHLDPYANDPSRWGTSMAHFAEILLPCLNATGARSVIEVGAFAGDLTRLLVAWAVESDAHVGAIDPAPQKQLVELADEHPELDLIRETSLEALPHIELPDVVIIDGDHNYYTVREELRMIEARAPGSNLPLLLFHDVSWPHARRDDYFDVDKVPASFRQPLAGSRGGILPEEGGLRPGGGLPYPRSAATEGGEHNGVLTAVEDFVAAHEDLRLVVVPAFFGFGAVWNQHASWAGELAEILRPWDRNAMLVRLEANRVHHLAEGETRRAEIWKLQERLARQEFLLRRLLDSSAFGVAERLSALRERAGIAKEHVVVSKQQIRRVLGD
ncbi:MAG: class I SAM-dependent methyltransferase [Solirubrobacteraceae bacterium]